MSIRYVHSAEQPDMFLQCIYDKRMRPIWFERL